MIKPLGQNIIVQKDPAKPTMEGGILIPECAERTPRFAPTILGTVVAVGSKVQQLRPGMRVCLKIYAGDEWFFDGNQITILREKDIVGIAS